MTGQELAQLLIEGGAVPVPGKATMFQLGDNADLQARVFEAVRSMSGTVYLLPSDDPSEDYPAWSWEHADVGTWVLPPEATLEALFRGPLNVGAWRIYVAEEPAPAEDAPDLFRGPTIAALDFLERYGARVVLDAWHDNSEWRVAVELSVP